MSITIPTLQELSFSALCRMTDEQISSKFEESSEIEGESKETMKDRAIDFTSFLHLQDFDLVTLTSMIKKALERDNPILLRIFMSDPKINEIELDSLNEQFEKSYEEGKMNSVRLFMEKHFPDIDRDGLVEALLTGIRKDQCGVVRALMVHDRFSEFNAENLGWALEVASRFGSSDRLVRSLTADAHFSEISADELGGFLTLASHYGHLDVVQVFMENSRISEIGTDKLREALRTTNRGSPEIARFLRREQCKRTFMRALPYAAAAAVALLGVFTAYSSLANESPS